MFFQITDDRPVGIAGPSFVVFEEVGDCGLIKDYRIVHFPLAGCKRCGRESSAIMNTCTLKQ
jgi:hypothetical protein